MCPIHMICKNAEIWQLLEEIGTESQSKLACMQIDLWPFLAACKCVVCSYPVFTITRVSSSSFLFCSKPLRPTSSKKRNAFDSFTQRPIETNRPNPTYKEFLGMSSLSLKSPTNCSHLSDLQTWSQFAVVTFQKKSLFLGQKKNSSSGQ